MATVTTTAAGNKIIKLQSRSAIDVALKRTDVKDWDDEELQYGRRRASDGTLRGRPPSYIPKACFDELHRRMRQKAEYLMLVAIPELIPQLIQIAKGKKVAAQDQVRAMNMILERTLGKPVEHLQVTAEVPWQDAIMEGIVGVEGDFRKGDRQVIDADLVDDEDLIDWEDA